MHLSHTLDQSEIKTGFMSTKCFTKECWVEVGEVKGWRGARPRLWDLHWAPHPSREGLLLHSSPLLPSQDLFLRAPLPYRMFGVGHWMLASCVLGGGWQPSEGQTPCRMWGGGGNGGVGVLHKHITWNREAHSIVPSAISAVSCYELCSSLMSTAAGFKVFSWIQIKHNIKMLWSDLCFFGLLCSISLFFLNCS